jgi:hypothetical protein
MNFVQRFAPVGIFIIIVSALYLGCGEEDDPGTLEIHLKNLDAVTGQNLTVVVRANGDEKRRSDLQDVISVPLVSGVANIGIDLINGDEVKFSGPHEVPIEGNQIARIEVDLREVFPPPGGNPNEVLVARFRTREERFVGDSNPTFPRPNKEESVLEVSGGTVIAEGFTVVEDQDGKQIDEFIRVIESTFENGLLELVDEAELLWKGNATSRFTMYRDRKSDNNIIFEGRLVTDPSGSLWMGGIPLDGTFSGFTKYKQSFRLQGVGKGSYSNHILKGKGEVELIGSQLQGRFEAEIFRPRTP